MLKKITVIFLIFLCPYKSLFSQQVGQNEDVVVNLERFDDDIRFENANNLYSIGMTEKALQLFGEYVEIFPNGIHRIQVLNNMASIYFDRYDYQRAIRYYLMVYEENSNTNDGLTAFYNVGLCYQKMGNFEKATAIFNKIIRDNPSSPVSLKAQMQFEVDSILNE